LRAVVGDVAVPARSSTLQRLGWLGAPAEVTAFYQSLNWRSGYVEKGDVFLRDVQSLLRANRSALGETLNQAGFVVVAETIADRDAFAVATSLQSDRPVGSTWRFARGLRATYEPGTSKPSWNGEAAGWDFGEFLRSFLAGTLPGQHGRRSAKPIWRAGPPPRPLPDRSLEPVTTAPGGPRLKPTKRLAAVIGAEPRTLEEAVEAINRYIAKHKLKPRGLGGVVLLDEALEDALDEKVEASDWKLPELVRAQLTKAR